MSAWSSSVFEVPASASTARDALARNWPGTILRSPLATASSCERTSRGLSARRLLGTTLERGERRGAQSPALRLGAGGVSARSGVAREPSSHSAASGRAKRCARSAAFREAEVFACAAGLVRSGRLMDGERNGCFGAAWRRWLGSCSAVVSCWAAWSAAPLVGSRAALSASCRYVGGAASFDRRDEVAFEPAQPADHV